MLLSSKTFYSLLKNDSDIVLHNAQELFWGSLLSMMEKCSVFSVHDAIVMSIVLFLMPLVVT